MSPAAQYHENDTGELITHLQRQREHFLSSPYPDLAQRRDKLRRLALLLEHEEESIVSALMEDFGYRSPDQTRFAEVVTTLREIRHCSKHVARWMRAERRRAGMPFNISGGWAEIHYQPLGVVGIIGPWNFPVNLCLSPLAGVLAAGNCAMLKPSELTPATADWMKQAFPKYFSPEEVQVVTGGVNVANEFSSLPFDHLVFTGSEHVAKQVMRNAAENLVPLTLELGGKSPVIIGKGTNISLAAERLLFGKVFNAGQVCLAPDTVYVPELQIESLLAGLEQAATNQLAAGERDYVRVINDRQNQRLQAYLDEAKSAGVRVEILANAAAGMTKAMPISVVCNPGPDLAISKQEIFGPLLVVRGYQDLDQVIESIQQGARPLAMYYFGSSTHEQQRLLRETHSGGMTINDVIMHYTISDLPFGGVGPSGMGSYHGQDGFKQFSHCRSVFKQSSFDVGRLMRPPYGRGFALLSTMMRRWL